MSNVAMLIDWENIKACATKYLGTPPDIVTLKKIGRRYGKLTIARAYADWTDPSGWHADDVERLTSQGVEPIFVWTRRANNNFAKDMVDFRLSCDGMELLAIHPEITCFVIVSGDVAFEAVLAKLSSHGKRIVRVSTKGGLTGGMHVLGEERVLYDDWIKGFKLPRKQGPVGIALESFATAVASLRSAAADNGLQSVKEAMRRIDPEFEEEKLGVPTFRHLAYLAEARGLVRIDGRREPAQAYTSAEEKATDGTFLPTGEMWLEFLQRFELRSDYDKKGLEALFEGVEVDGKPANALISLARESDVITHVSRPIVTQDWKTKQAREVWTNKHRLNLHHPRVQVALAGLPGGP